MNSYGFWTVFSFDRVNRPVISVILDLSYCHIYGIILDKCCRFGMCFRSRYFYFLHLQFVWELLLVVIFILMSSSTPPAKLSDG
jgi:hypothetical protein